METLNADLLIQVISFLNVVDASRLATATRRMYYLVHEYTRIEGPELLAVSSWSEEKKQNQTASELVKEGISKINGHPNIAFAFNTRSGRDNLAKVLDSDLPEDTVVLGSIANSVQANCSGQVEASSNAALMLGSFPPENTKILPFALGGKMTDLSKLDQQLQKATPIDEDAKTYWKVFLVYSCGDGYYQDELFVSHLQARHLDAVIVGGICESGFVRMDPSSMIGKLRKKDGEELSRERLQMFQIDEGMFGVAMGGDVPVRSVVSRGVRSLTSGSGPWFVDDVVLARPGDEEDYPFQGDEELLKPVHIIRTIRNSETGKRVSCTELLSHTSRRPEFIGLCRQNDDGFEILNVALHDGNLLIMTDGSLEQEKSFEKANVDLFQLDGQACIEDIDVTLARLREQTKHENVLGGIMFSCAGRGPDARSLMKAKMADATTFHKYFPDVSCLGFYCGGEIGPIARAGNRNVFRRGRAQLQGYTAVFALFIVPVVKPGSYHLDDGEENVAGYIQAKLAA